MPSRATRRPASRNGGSGRWVTRSWHVAGGGEGGDGRSGGGGARGAGAGRHRGRALHGALVRHHRRPGGGGRDAGGEDRRLHCEARHDASLEKRCGSRRLGRWGRVQNVSAGSRGARPETSKNASRVTFFLRRSDGLYVARWGSGVRPGARGGSTRHPQDARPPRRGSTRQTRGVGPPERACVPARAPLRSRRQPTAPKKHPLLPLERRRARWRLPRPPCPHRAPSRSTPPRAPMLQAQRRNHVHTRSGASATAHSASWLPGRPRS